MPITPKAIISKSITTNQTRLGNPSEYFRQYSINAGIWNFRKGPQRAPHNGTTTPNRGTVLATMTERQKVKVSIFHIT